MRYFLAIFLSFSSLLLATTPQEDGIDVSETEGLPSSIVNGVCVISGGYTAAQADIIVPGPESLVFQRHYSSDVPGGQFGLGWGINHDEKIEVQKFSEGGVNERSKPFWLLTLSQSSGTQLTYEHAKKGKDHRFLRDNKKVELDLNVPRGLTNGAHLLSGRTNLNNQTIAYEGGSRDQFRMKTGAGNRKLFSIHGKKHGFEEFENIHYILKYEIKPNGSKYDYHHQEDDLYHINCKSRETKKLFNAIRIEKIDQGKEKFSKKLITSDGRFIDYQFKYKKYKNSANQESKDYLCLTDVSSPFVVDEHYSYEEDAHGKSPHLLTLRTS